MGEVKKARDERAAEISKARAEAIEDTRKAREKREADFAEEFDSKSDDTASQDQERIAKMKEDMDKSESQFSQNKKKVVDLMLGLVTTVDLKVPDTLKYKLKQQNNQEF